MELHTRPVKIQIVVIDNAARLHLQKDLAAMNNVVERNEGWRLESLAVSSGV